MPYTGIRITKELDNAIKKMMEKTDISKSELIRNAIESYVLKHLSGSNEKDWKPIAWTFLGVDSHKLNYALARSENASEFFSMIARWTKHNIVVMSGTDVVIQLKTDMKNFTAKANPQQPKTDIISQILFSLEEQYTNYVMEEL